MRAEEFNEDSEQEVPDDGIHIYSVTDDSTWQDMVLAVSQIQQVMFRVVKDIGESFQHVHDVVFSTEGRVTALEATLKGRDGDGYTKTPPSQENAPEAPSRASTVESRREHALNVAIENMDGADIDSVLAAANKIHQHLYPEDFIGGGAA